MNNKFLGMKQCDECGFYVDENAYECTQCDNEFDV